MSSADFGNPPGEFAHEAVFPDIAKFRRQALSKNPNPKRSAVGATFVPVDEQAHVVLIQRQSYDGVHSGQIAFPGGKIEDSDTSLEHTARRETEEEVGIIATDLVRVGHLTEVYIPPSGYLVKPYIFYLPTLPSFTPDPREVSQIMTLPVEKLLESNPFDEGKIATGRGTHINTRYIPLGDKKIWGATAMMLSELRILLQSI